MGMLFDLVFRRWGPEVRGAACTILALLSCQQREIGGLPRPRTPTKAHRAFAPLGALRHWWNRGPYPSPSPELGLVSSMHVLLGETEDLDGLPCCAAALVRFMEMATRDGLAQRVVRKDSESAE